MSIQLNSENRNRNTNITSRRCSFCRRQGHHIVSCNSQAIIMIENEVLQFIESLTQQQVQLRFVSFRNYLVNKALSYPNIVKAFAIKHCDANTRNNIVECIELIIQHFIPQIQNIEINLQNIEEEPGIEEREITLEMYTETDISRIIELIRTIYQPTQFNTNNRINKKFYIKTTISEKQNDLHKKCECNICYNENEKKNFIKLDCGHEFCKVCIKKTLQNDIIQNDIRKTPCCAFCRKDITNFEIKHESIKNEFDKLITSVIEI